MEIIGIILFVFISLIEWLIIIEIVLSWLGLLGLYIQIPFISNIVRPMFDKVADILPVRFMGLDFSPIVILFAIMIVKGLLMTLFPEIQLLPIF